MNRSPSTLERFALTTSTRDAASKVKRNPIQGFDCIALGYRNGSRGLEFLAPKSFIRAIEEACDISLKELLQLHTRELKNKDGKVEAKAGEMVALPLATRRGLPDELLFFAIGSEKVVDARKSGALLGRRYRGKSKKVLISAGSHRFVSQFLESLLLSTYQWSEKTTKSSDRPAFHILDGKELERIRTIASHVFTARDLIHTPSNIKTPAWIASRLVSLTKSSSASSRLKVVTKSGKEIAEFGGLVAVGGSSTVHPPRFVVVSYTPPKAKKHVVLVGKGITFDTGGVSLKRPYDMMMAMKTDMSGAAVVAATVLAAAELRLPIKVSALLMLAENTLSATAQRPSDVITHYGGTTVEVINTDAEGRLVLADGLAYADRHLDPDYLIDVATLTGAASLGLGKQYGAMYSRDEKLASQLHQIGETAGDRLWHMPLIDDYQIALKSEIADFNHIADKPKFGAGSVTAALFLEKFVGKRRWVHLDIAGPARSEVDAGEYVKGGTGFGVRTLTAWLATL
ncbi:MAG: leucyl aminopeptidase family protein [Candidatus Nanopelagicaceae bacterium]